ncbi:MAG: hypothetical protein LCH81_09510 [Bacteroidetes bacterium]|nr:hypothetical protein [Bacteroidota bacterium]
MIPKDLPVTQHGNIIHVLQPSFWIDDVKQISGDNKIEVRLKSEKDWLHVKQQFSEECYILPVDGKFGVFGFSGLPVRKPDDFKYDWTKEDPSTGKTQTVTKGVGDCDCLIIHNMWHFIEFKTDASSTSLIQIDNNTRKAFFQLARTLTSVREACSHIFNAKCLIVGPKIYPKTPASIMTQKLKFKKYNADLEFIKVDDTYHL